MEGVYLPTAALTGENFKTKNILAEGPATLTWTNVQLPEYDSLTDELFECQN